MTKEKFIIEDFKLTPKEIVEYLDKYIVGQFEAKKAVAIAIRNRYRRMKVENELKDEIMPKNILMIGPTGVGKTEIARRLAKLVKAPFIKVEASKYTEVGYVGRDVESMIRDLIEVAVNMVKKEHMKKFESIAKENVNRRILDALLPRHNQSSQNINPFANLFQAVVKGTGISNYEHSSNYNQNFDSNTNSDNYHITYEKMKKMLEEGQLESRLIEIEVKESSSSVLEVISPQGLEEVGFNISAILGGIFPERRKKKTVTVAEARTILYDEEINKLIDMDMIVKEAIFRTENSGIVFIDEIDKIAGVKETHGPDVSREGVQRDILPILEGTTVNTKYGQVKTDHILFIAAGAFHVSKPSDLIPELQGRFPIRVELKNLNCDDFVKILSEPQNSIIKQYQALFLSEGVELIFEQSAILEIAKVAFEYNLTVENIGARRLYTVCEKLLEDLLFELPKPDTNKIIIDDKYVKEHLSSVSSPKDLNKYFL